MGWELSGRTIGCLPERTTSFSAADNTSDDNIVVTLVDNALITSPKPRVKKANSTDKVIYGKFSHWDAGAGEAVVQTDGIVEMTKGTTGVTGDIGLGVEAASETTVATAATGVGIVIGYNGTTLYVDLG